MIGFFFLYNQLIDMKFLIFLMTACNVVISQNKETLSYNEIPYSWVAITKGGNFVYGVSETKAEAKIIIEDFNKRNRNSINVLLYYNYKKHKFHFIQDKIVKQFLKNHPKKYRVLSRVEFMSIYINRDKDFNSAVHYYNDATNIPIDRSAEHLKELFSESSYFLK